MAKRKNRIEAKLSGCVINVKIIASDEEMAHKIFDLIEAFGIAGVKTDLEREWREQG